jgi:hypothetical protein
MNDRPSSTLATTRAPGRSHRAVALARVDRWKWTLLALVVGPLAAWLWSRSPDALTASGYSISQAQFESGLLRVVKHPETGEPIIGRDGEPRRHFEDLTLYRTNHRDAYGRDVSYIVTGRFTNGRVETYKEDGGGKTREIRWRDAFFPATDPYAPLTPATQQHAPEGLGTGSVRDYLDRLHAQGVRYRHAWWRESRIATPLFTAASVLVIDGMWPTLLSLAAFGTVFPPRDAHDTHVPSLGKSAAAAGSPSDLSAVHSLASTLETQLTSAATCPVPAPPPPARTQPIPRLNAALVSPPPGAPAAPAKAFGQGQDDFYPTELKPSADPPSHPPPARPGGTPSRFPTEEREGHGSAARPCGSAGRLQTENLDRSE